MSTPHPGESGEKSQSFPIAPSAPTHHLLCLSFGSSHTDFLVVCEHNAHAYLRAFALLVPQLGSLPPLSVSMVCSSPSSGFHSYITFLEKLSLTIKLKVTGHT